MERVITIGRDINCDIVLSEACIYASQKHATMYMDGEQIMYRDNSTNGTFINNISVHNRTVPVEFGDVIMLAGNYQLDWSKIEEYFPRRQNYDRYSQEEVQTPQIPQMPENLSDDGSAIRAGGEPFSDPKWSAAIGTLIAAIWTYTLSGFADSINDIVLMATGSTGLLSLLKGNDNPVGVADMLGEILPLLVLYGYYLFFSSLSKFSKLQRSEADAQSVMNIRKGYLLLILAIMLDYIPFVGFIASFITIIVAYVKMLSGYNELRNSETFPASARQGAATLRSCTIWIIVGAVVNIIPILGPIAKGIISVVTFFSILSAWGVIRKSGPQLTAMEIAALEAEQRREWKNTLGNAMMALLCVPVVSAALFFKLGAGERTYTLAANMLFGLIGFIPLLVAIILLRTKVLNWNAKRGLLIYTISPFIIMIPSLVFVLIDSGNTNTILIIVLILSTIVSCCGYYLFMWNTLFDLRIKILLTVNFLLSILAANLGYYLSLSQYVLQAYSLGCNLITAIILFFFLKEWKEAVPDDAIERQYLQKGSYSC